MMKNESDFQKQLNEAADHANHIIESYLPKEEGELRIIAEPMNYSVRAGGKRLRPILIRETSRMYMEDCKEVEPFMAAMEMMHTSSLIHDDLPAIDNDDYRRGKKTTHVMYGEDMAILAGDVLMNYAYETAIHGILNARNPERYAKALDIFASKSGIHGMLGGQSVDVYWTGKKLEKDRLMFIHANKTGALIEASMMIGAVLGGASEDDLLRIEEAGHAIGMAFQIQDDILDICGDEKTLGKPVHSDEKNDKQNYVTIFGMEKARHEVDAYTNIAETILKETGKTNTFLLELLHSLIRRKF